MRTLPSYLAPRVARYQVGAPIVETPQELVMLALVDLDLPEVKADLSYAGSLYSSALKVSALKATGAAKVSEAIKIAGPALVPIFDEIRKILPQVLIDLAKTAGAAVSNAVAGIGDAIPFVSTVVAVVDTSNAISAANQEKSQQDCRAYFRPPYKHPGKPRPADLFNTRFEDGTFGIEGTVGEVFRVADQSYEASAGKFLHVDIPAQPGIPPERRKLLETLRLAITRSLNDPTTDGGASIWPIYLDLLWSEHVKGHWNYGQVFYDWANYVLPPYHDYSGGAAGGTLKPGECARWEQRAYDSFVDIMEGWGGKGGLLNPIYVDDVADAEALKAQIAQAEAKLLGEPTYNLSHIKVRQKRSSFANVAFWTALALAGAKLAGAW